MLCSTDLFVCFFSSLYLLNVLWLPIWRIKLCIYYIYIAHSRKAYNALFRAYASKGTWRISWVRSLVASSSPHSLPRRKPDDRKSNADVGVRAADGSRWTTDADLKLGLRSEVHHTAWCHCLVPLCPNLVSFPRYNMSPDIRRKSHILIPYVYFALVLSPR